jgi:hypothetical protein
VGEKWPIAPGTEIDFNDETIDIRGAIQVDGEEDSLGVYFEFSTGYLNFTSDTYLDSSYLNYLNITKAPYGLYLSGVGGSGSARLEVSNCTFDSCGVGVYANNSRLSLTNCTISNSNLASLSGAGVYLTNCSAGKVIIDDCEISGNGIDETYSSAGMFLSSSSPEIINTTIFGNSGCGIAALSSTPDLDTYDWLLLDDQHNDIYENGSGTQSGSDGAEIALFSSSYPDVHYNNVHDGGGTPNGVMVFKDDMTNLGGIYAEYNWWGTSTPDDDFFEWGSGAQVIYSPAESSEISSAQLFAAGMELWDAGDFAGAAEAFRECVMDTGAVGIKAIHYLAGCVGEIGEDGQARRLSYAGLREYLQGVAEDHQSAEVAWIARRFATDCLTSLGEYETAMEEYDMARREAGNVSDSVMAIIDFLAVQELANGPEVNSSGESIQERMRKALDRLNGSGGGGAGLVPERLEIVSAYPNPFNSTTTIRFFVSPINREATRVGIYDLQGRLVADLTDKRGGLSNSAGLQSVTWNAENATAGTYFCKVTSGDDVQSMKVLLVK